MISLPSFVNFHSIGKTKQEPSLKSRGNSFSYESYISSYSSITRFGVSLKIDELNASDFGNYFKERNHQECLLDDVKEIHRKETSS